MTDVLDFGEVELTSLSAAFYGAVNLTNVPASLPSGVTDLSYCFRNASKFNGDISGWDVSAVTLMRDTFRSATNFNQNIGGWNVSNVTVLLNTFYDARQFNQDIGAWNVGKVTSMMNTFYNASCFNQNLNAWNVSNVTSMAYTFYGCSAFNGALDAWDVGKVANMSYMFYSATNFNQDIGSWNVRSVTSMDSMLSTTPFNQDIGSWVVTNVTSMSSMFYNAAHFNQDISGWDVSRVQNLSQMFYRATAFNQDIGGWDVGRVQTMSQMFRQAYSFNQDIGGWDVSSVTTFDTMFSGAVFNRDIGSWVVTNAGVMSSMFQGNTNFNQDLSGWDVSSVSNMHSMFYGATAFDQNLGPWNISRVTIMTNMFRDVKLSIANYSAILTNWAALSVQSNVYFTAGNSLYSAGAAATARQSLIDNYNWTISDGGMFSYTFSTNNGPYVGGGTIVITNCSQSIGNGSNITNVLVGGQSAVITGQGTNWVSFILPAAGGAGAVDVIVQSSGSGATTFADAYTYNPQGEIIGGDGIYDWEVFGSFTNTGLTLGSLAGLSNELYMLSASNSNVWRYTEGALESLPSLPEVTMMGRLLTWNGDVYSIGGMNDHVYRFTGTGWELHSTLPMSIYEQAVSVYQDKMVVLGGQTGSNSSNTWYCEGTNWVVGPNMPFKKVDFGCGEVGGLLYAVGGGMTPSNVCSFDGTNWVTESDIPFETGGGYNNACSLHGSLYMMGGASVGGALTNVYRYNGSAWSETKGMPTGMSYQAACTMDDYIYTVAQSDDLNIYRFGGPVSSGVSPANGLWSGGYSITISGSNLGNGSDITNVTLCDVAVTNIESQSATQVVVWAGQSATSVTGDVCVYSVSYGTTVKTNAFTYLEPVIGVFGTNGADLVNGEAPSAEKGTDYGSMVMSETLVRTNAFSITNSGNAVLNITDVITNGAAADSYTVQNLPSSIATGEVAQFQVRLYPLVCGTVTASVEIVTDATNSPFVMNFTAFVDKQTQTIENIQPANGTWMELTSTNELSAQATSDGAVSFTNISGPGVISGGTNLTFTDVGTVEIVASQPGNGYWYPAPDVTNTYYVYALTANNGPYAGGNTMIISNATGFGTVTNVLVGGVSVTPTDSGTNWFTITMPAATNAGTVDFVVQSSDQGPTTLSNAYTYNPQGQIGMPPTIIRVWTNMGAGLSPLSDYARMLV